MKYNINEENIRAIIKEVLNEANNSLPFQDFLRDMKTLGFEVRRGDGSIMEFRMPDKGINVTVHLPHGTGRNDAKADMLRNTFNELKKHDWFDDPANRKLYNDNMAQRWGLKAPSANGTVVDVNAEIEEANEQYENYEVSPIFPMKNSVCILTHHGEGYNICRSPQDRRPLLDQWYKGYTHHLVDGELMPCLTYDEMNGDDIEQWHEYFIPIKTDGTLDMEKMITESKLNANGKSRLW